MRKLALTIMRLAFAALLLSTPAAQAAPASTYTVNISFDTPDQTPGDNLCADVDGLCTLRAAVMEANAHPGPDTILLTARTYHLTRVGAGEDAALTGDLDLTGTVTLQGQGPAASIIDAAGLGDRIFDVLTGTTVSMSRLTLSGAGLLPTAQERGGGLQNRGALTLTQVLITHNDASQSLVQGGGGIVNWDQGRLVLINSQVISNTGYTGGGIYNKGEAILTSSQVISNFALGGGGGARNEGVMTISGSQVLSNSAVSSGGGLANVLRLTVANSTIGGNRAAGGGGIDSLNSSPNSQLSLTGSTIRDNIAQSLDGGGLFTSGVATVTTSLFTGNSTGAQGGGIAAYTRPLHLENVTLAGNTANSNGAGLLASTGATVNGYNLTVINNLADADNNSAGAGGGLFRAAGAPVSLYNSVLAYNNHLGGDFQVADDCTGNFDVFSYTLVKEPAGCPFIDDHSFTLAGQDPLLLPLAPNGGPTLTSALGPGSPALDAGNPAGCLGAGGSPLLTDQRGFIRPADGDHNGTLRCDIGAFEALRQLFLPLLRR
ncbi:MAG: choice-of-anchor Q domain-containing protein [Anaerolineales bacterium]